MSVYLLDAKGGGKVKAYKLPSLFAACSEVRLDRDGRPLFFDAEYVYVAGSDNAIGTALRECVISNADFVRTGHAVTTRFVSPTMSGSSKWRPSSRRFEHRFATR